MAPHIQLPAAKDPIADLLTRGVDAVVDRAHLEAALRSGRSLRVKLGIDPTGPKIHIGRACTLWKLRAFQELGHKIVLIIGTATGQIGDPSDKIAKRPMLTEDAVRKNLTGYVEQMGAIIRTDDPALFETRENGDWISNLTFAETATLAESFSVQQMLARRNFKTRWDAGEEISLREMLYPLMQGYDSVAIKADVELGGADQLFNLHAGRTIQQHYGQEPQDLMMLQMLPGLDGRKMSTSWGNIITIVDEPGDMYGKVMSMADAMMPDYFALACPHLATEEATALAEEARAGTGNPRDLKMRLARELVTLYHGEKAAQVAEEAFVRVFQKREMPQDIPTVSVPGEATTLASLLVAADLAPSKAEAQRLIVQGGVEVNEVIVRDPKASPQDAGVAPGVIIRVGKRRFVRIS